MEYARPAVTPATRNHALDRLRSEIFDSIILGGGINGAGTARDLALRAVSAKASLRLGLVEQNHFGSGTSGKNSHLVHGGLRYLKQLRFGLVRESLHERAVLLRIAPHLVEPQPFLLPINSLGQDLIYGLGLTIYDRMSADHTAPHHRRLSLEEVRQLEPGLAVPGMTGAVEFHDAKVRSARLVLENIFEAISNDAACANYLRAENRIRKKDGSWRLRLRDQISGETFEARTRSLVDATGPWAHDPAPRLVRGSHIVLPRLNAGNHAIAYFQESGRIVFFIPWGERDNRTLVGTTEVDFTGSPDQVHISEAEIAYLRSIAARVFPESAKHDPLATFSSLRPLLASSGSPTRASREHRIFYDAEGVLRITGGKFTTYRAMSEEAADRLTARISPALRHVHVTADRALNGNTSAAINALLEDAADLASHYSLTADDIKMLVKQYGVLTPAVLTYLRDETSPDGLSRLDAARLAYATQHEMVLRPRDFLEVSTSLALEGATYPSFRPTPQAADPPIRGNRP